MKDGWIKIDAETWRRADGLAVVAMAAGNKWFAVLCDGSGEPGFPSACDAQAWADRRLSTLRAA